MIDIIIPVYNSRDSIVKCISSIYVQTISNLVNVYLIDDCSSEEYDDLISFYKDKININLIRLEKNSGPGVARQVGLNNSNGRYILFLDSDDYLINCFALENMYNAMSNRDDVIVFGYTIIEGKDGNFRRINNEGSLHAKMFCRNIINKYNLEFYPGYNHEDLSFYLLYLATGVDTVYIENDVYFYTYNSKSITNVDSKTYELDKSGKYIDNIIWYVDNCEERGFSKVEIASNIYYALVILYNIYNSNYESKDAKKLIIDTKRLYKVCKKYDDYLNDSLKIELYNSTGRDFIPVLTFDDFLDIVSK